MTTYHFDEEYDGPQDAFDRFWKPIVCDPQGFFTPDAVKAELHDYLMLLEYVPKVYSEVTGGRICKPYTHPHHVTSAADDHYQMIFREDMKDLYDTLAVCQTLDEALEQFREWTGINV
jgi:hypothetical protein